MKKTKIKQKKSNLLEVLSVLNEVTGNFIAIKELLKKMVQQGLNQEEIEQFKNLISSEDTLKIRDNNYEQDPELINFIYKNRLKIEQKIDEIASKITDEDQKNSFYMNATRLFGTETINLNLSKNDTYTKFWQRVFPLYADVYNAQELIRKNIKNSQLSEYDKKRELDIFNEIIEKRNHIEKSFDEFLKKNKLENLYKNNPFSLHVDKTYNDALENYIKTEKGILNSFFQNYVQKTKEKPSSATDVVRAVFSPGQPGPTKVTPSTSSRLRDIIKARPFVPGTRAELQENLKLKKLSLKEAMEKEYD